MGAALAPRDSEQPERVAILRRLLASHRFRRRSAWLGACLALAGLVAFLGLHFSNTGQKERETFTPGKPQLVPKEPKSDPFTPVERKAVRAIAVRFIESAVYRRNVADSFALTTGGLRQGLSRREWATGEIPIVPFPQKAVEIVRYRLDYSFAREVGLKVAFYPKVGSEVERQVFEISLENHGTQAAPRWLVSYWAPVGGEQLSRADPRAPSVDTTPPEPRLGAIWLLLPFGVIAGGLVGLVAFLVIRGRIRHARAVRRYRSSSSPS